MFSSVESLVAEGRLEEALDELVRLLDAEPRFESLALAAKIQQSALASLQDQSRRDVISAEQLRLETNRITSQVLDIVGRAEKGADAAPPDLPPRKAWRYYLAGGITALLGALAVWYFLKKKEDCPNYSDRVSHRVMIVPFRDTGEKNSGELAVDIADALSVKINRTPRLRDMAEVAILEQFREPYPSPQRAEELARHCEVQMIVWGKINQSDDKNYKLDVRYRLLRAGQVLLSGDTSLNNLVRAEAQGHLIRDLETVTDMLYLVLASNAQVPADHSLLASLKTSADAAPDAALATDTSLLLLVAENHARMGRYDKAIETYNRVLEIDPDNPEAHQKRGALLYEKGDYAAALDDLHAAQPEPAKASPDLLKTRTEAALKGGYPKRAEADLKAISKQKLPADSLWLRQKQLEVRDSIQSLQKQRDAWEKRAKTNPENAKVSLRAAQTNLALEEPDRALKIVSKTVQNNPDNSRARDIAVAAYLMKKDTAAAQRLIQSAAAAGTVQKRPRQ